MVIFTSPLCDSIINVKKRFANVSFDNILTKTYMLYCIGTLENNKLNDQKENAIISVIDETENNMIYDENTGDIIL